MKTRFYTLFIGVFTLITLAACSSIKEAFPDKSRDYLNTGQIPPLKMPAGLGGNSPLSASAANNPPEDIGSVTRSAGDAGASASTENAPVESKPITVALVKTKNAENSILIDAPFVDSWRMVNTALSHLPIEIIERNSQESLFTIKYNPDKKKSDESSYWDGFVSVFTGGDEEYRLKLVKNNSQTSVTVVDAQQQSLSNENTAKLLNTLQKTIQNDLGQSTTDSDTNDTSSVGASNTANETPVLETPSEKPRVDPTLITVELTRTKNGEDSIFIDAPFVKSWRMVNKALSHLSVEVTERNSQESLFTIQYNPDEKKVEDITYWDEIEFMFSGFVGGETELRLKLIEDHSQTSVIVVDAEQHSLSNELTQKLLSSLQKAIKDDLAQQ